MDVTDAIHTLGFSFLGIPDRLGCDDAADINDDGGIDVTDAVYTLTFLFLGGVHIPPPWEECGFDPTVDGLFCGDYPSCPQSEESFEEVRDDEKPAFTALQLAATPPFPIPGERVAFEFQVCNCGSPESRQVAVGLFSGGSLLARDDVVLPPDSVRSVPFSWVPPGGGVYELVAIVDPEQQYVEFNRRDNQKSVQLVVAPPPPAGADLKINNLELLAGHLQPARLAVTVESTVPVNAGTPLILRINSKPARVEALGPLAENQPQTFEIPWSSADAILSIEAEIQPRFAFSEPDAGNNRFSRSFAVGPDLRIEDLSVFREKPIANNAQQVTVNFRIVNAGSGDVTSAFRTHLSPGTSNFDAPNYYLADYDIQTSSLASGKSVAVSRSFFIPANVASFELAVHADAGSVIAESNEADNLASIRVNRDGPGVHEWVAIGPRRITDERSNGYGWDDSTGRLAAIAIHPTTPTIFYVGAQNCGVWKTLNGGAGWQPILDSATLNIAALALDPNNPARVFCASGHEGFYLSEDAGDSWQQVNSSDLHAHTHGGALLVDPVNSNRLLLTTRDGVLRSLNGGRDWSLALGGGTANGLILLRGTSTVLYASLGHDSDSSVAGIYRSLDGGATWRKMIGCSGGYLPAQTAGVKITLAASATRIYAGFQSADQFQVYRTSGLGCSVGGVLDNLWEKGWKTTSEHKEIWRSIRADPTDDRFVYLQGTHFWRSTDEGKTFELTAGLGGPFPGAHSDHHGFGVDSLNPSRIYTLCDGGIYHSDSRGAASSWSFVGDGILNVEIYDHALAATQPDRVIAGTQDNGNILHDGSSTVWKLIMGGDGASCEIDPTDASKLYGMGQYAASIARKIGADSFKCISCGLPEGSACANLPFQLHPRNPQILLACCDSLWRAVNPECAACPDGSTGSPGSPLAWSRILTLANLTPPEPGTVTRSAVDGSVDLYYAGSSSGRLYAGPGGASWRRLFIHPAGRSVNDLEVDPQNPTVIYAAFSGSLQGRIYRLQRAEIVPASLASRDITADLPTDLTAQCLAVDRVRPQVVYVGTQKGVWRGQSFDGGTTWFWRSYNYGLPLGLDIVDLETHPATGTLRAASYGRGAFEVFPDLPIGSLIALEGKLVFLRVHDVGTGFGPPLDSLDAEVIVRLDSHPERAFGFKLRVDPRAPVRRGMLDTLRDAFRGDRLVRVEYIRTGLQTGEILRVARLE